MSADFDTWTEFLAFWASLATVIGVVPAVGAVVYGARQLTLARRASSAAAIIPIDEMMRRCWSAYFATNDPRLESYAIAELMNAFELACAIEEDQLFVGVSGKLMLDTLKRHFATINRHEILKSAIVPMIDSDETFIHIRRFIEKHRPWPRG